MTYLLKIRGFRAIVACLLVLPITDGYGQASALNQIELTFNKTSSIVFPAVIASVDRGSPDVLAQKAKGVDNVLQLKAGRRGFEETNLTVITADGRLHHFLVRYAARPSVYTYCASPPENVKGDEIPLIFRSEMTGTEMKGFCRQILDGREKKRLKRTSKYHMNLALSGIYIQGNIMFFHLTVDNASGIPYHTDMLRLYVRDRRKLSRTASQELEKVPLYRHGNDQVFAARSASDIVYAIPKFTIPDSKLFFIELLEKEGGRHLALGVNNRKVIRARPLERGANQR